METQLTKTEAEGRLGELFSSVKGDLPGDADVVQARDAAFARFDALGLPHRRVEEWKYTDLRNQMADAYAPSRGGVREISFQALEAALGGLAGVEADIMVLVDGHYSPAQSLSRGEVKGVHVMPLSQALADNCFSRSHATVPGVPDNDAIVALNTAFMQDGVALHIADTPVRPLHIVHVTIGDAPVAATTRCVISVADGVDATIIESHLSLDEGPAQTNALTHLGIGANSTVQHIKVQDEAAETTHLGTWVVELGAGANYRACQFTSGGRLTRHQIYLRFDGEDASAHMHGTYLQRDKQHCDTTLVVDHAVPGCESRELYKGVLDDHARGVFQGKICVRQIAQKTDGQQMSQALMLSDTAEFDAKPELEIFADDVACGHGATTGQIEEDHLFYLMARGIDETTARALLIEAFAGEALDIIENEALREALVERTRRWLGV